ncbi:MAG: hypothetical protein RMJ13_02635 [Elusimicrobiota bacterium]|nr:hypothetical protein [Elusimicrobiota bacterium]
MLLYKTVIRKSLVLFLFHYLIYNFSHLNAGGISSPNAAMYISNLKIGQEYSLKQLLGYPFQVSYRGRFPVDLTITLEKPTTTTSDGYEPLPDLSWVQLEKSGFSLDPGETAETDIIIKIPNDEKLLGKKFHLNISPVTGPPKGDNRAGLVFAVGIVCKLYLAIAPKPPTIEEIREQQRRRLSGYLDVSVSPNRIFIYDIEPDKKYNFTKQFGEVIKVINATSQNVNVEIESIPPTERGIFLLEDQLELPQPGLLKTKPQKVKLKPDSVKSFELILDSKGLERQKKYLAVVKVRLFNERIDVNHYVKVYIETK